MNERKCAIIHLGPGPPPSDCSIWGSPFVEEYKYLGVLLGLSVPIEKVFEGALQKFRERAASFSSIKTNFTSKILLAKIYLYPLFSYLLNFYSFPPITEKVFCSTIQKFTECEIGKVALLLLAPRLPCVPNFNDMPSALLTSELLTAQQLFYHVCFAKALWKARCQAIWCINKVSPRHVCTLFWETVSKTKKTAPPPESQRSIIPLADIDSWSIRTRHFL